MEVRDQGRIGSIAADGFRIGPAEGRATQMPGAQLVTRKVSSDQTGGAYSLFEVTVGAGGGEGPHIQHREDECFYVLEGRFGFVVEGEQIEVGPGSLVYVPKGVLHAFENTDETTGRMLVSQTPGGAYERFIEEVGPLAAGKGVPPETEAPTEDAQRLAAVAALYGVEIVPLLP